MKNTWFEKHLISGKSSLPFSFTYDGQPSAPLLAEWASKAADERLDAHRTQHTLTWTDPRTGLEVRCVAVAYADSPAVEWTVWFKNTGTADTPIIEDIRALDIVHDCARDAAVRLYHSKGTVAAMDDFALQEKEIGRRPESKEVQLLSRDGSSRNCLPFFNVAMPGGGLILVIGWTGNWTCTVGRSEDGNVDIRAGMARTYLRLHPGEEIRTPRILVLAWEGERVHAHNQLRRHLVAHHLPKENGQTVEPPLCDATWGGMKTATHMKTLKFLEDHRLAFDCYWIDAGWYGPDHETEEFQNFHTEDWAYHIGHWRVNRVVHPDGLRPIADRVHALGMKLLLWFSPYLAEIHSPLLQEHPEWILQQNVWGANGIGLNKTPVNLCSFDIGNPAARRFLVDYISGLIAEHGVDHFRDDCGVPLPPPERDAPDRQGIGEIRAVEGFYEFWDELRRRHPGMLIDNCGGGGSRIDLETIRRCLVLWRSDYNCHPNANPIGMQVGTYGLAHWIPLVGGGAPARPGDTYNFRSSWNGGIPFGLFHAGGFGHATLEPAPDYPVEWHRQMLADYRRVRPYLTGDFYPLTPGTVRPQEWCAWQMDRPDLGEGFVLAFRREYCEASIQTYRLRGIDPAARYEVTNLDVEGATVVSGRDLLEKGLAVEIPDQTFEKIPPDGCLDIALPGEGMAFGPFPREAGVPSAELLRRVPAELALGSVCARSRTFVFRNCVTDLGSLLKVEGETAWVYLPFTAPESGRAAFGFGADWWYEAYLDGVVISETLSSVSGNKTQPPSFHDHVAVVDLQQGEHLLVVRLVRGQDTAVLAVGGGSRDMKDPRFTASGSAVLVYRRVKPEKGDS